MHVPGAAMAALGRIKYMRIRSESALSGAPSSLGPQLKFMKKLMHVPIQEKIHLSLHICICAAYMHMFPSLCASIVDASIERLPCSLQTFYPSTI